MQPIQFQVHPPGPQPLPGKSSTGSHKASATDLSKVGMSGSKDLARIPMSATDAEKPNSMKKPGLMGRLEKFLGLPKGSGTKVAIFAIAAAIGIIIAAATGGAALVAVAPSLAYLGTMLFAMQGMQSVAAQHEKSTAVQEEQLEMQKQDYNAKAEERERKKANEKRAEEREEELHAAKLAAFKLGGTTTFETEPATSMPITHATTITPELPEHQNCQ